ncbi:hypothetical protein [Methanocaldococcus sp.]
MGEQNLILEDVKIVLNEWIPFGKNYITDFIDRLTLKRYQKTRKFFTSIEEADLINNPIFEIKGFYTTVEVIEFSPEIAIKFRTNYENRDVFVYADYLGRVLYSSQIVGNVDFRKLSFIVPDLILNSSKMILNFLSPSQRFLLEGLYGKVKLYKHISILTTTIFDLNQENLGKISQIIGTIKNIIRVDDGFIIFGDYGVLIAHKTPEKFEKFIYYYPFIRSLTGVSKDLFFKINNIASKLEKIGKVLGEGIKWEVIGDIRAELSKIDREMAIIETTLGYLDEVISILKKSYPPNFDEFELNLLELLDTKRKIDRLEYRIEEIRNILKSNENLATSLTRLLTTISEDLEREIVHQLANNTKYQVALGEAMELLEIGIFGVYALEAVHILLITSGYEDKVHHIYFLGLPLDFWIILFSIILGVYVGTYLIKKRKRRILESDVR